MNLHPLFFVCFFEKTYSEIKSYKNIPDIKKKYGNLLQKKRIKGTGIDEIKSLCSWNTLRCITVDGIGFYCVT